MINAARWLCVGALFLFCLGAAAQERAQPKLPTAPLVIETSIGMHRFMVEMALSPHQREIGLMFRTQMADDEGMLFSTGRDEVTMMWMKNTPLPLDMVFIEADGIVTGIAENTMPQSLRPISSDVPVRAVLELKAGTARRMGLKSGNQVHNALFGNAVKEQKP